MLLFHLRILCLLMHLVCVIPLVLIPSCDFVFPGATNLFMFIHKSWSHLVVLHFPVHLVCVIPPILIPLYDFVLPSTTNLFAFFHQSWFHFLFYVSPCTVSNFGWNIRKRKSTLLNQLNRNYFQQWWYLLGQGLFNRD